MFGTTKLQIKVDIKRRTCKCFSKILLDETVLTKDNINIKYIEAKDFKNKRKLSNIAGDKWRFNNFVDEIDRLSRKNLLAKNVVLKIVKTYKVTQGSVTISWLFLIKPSLHTYFHP